MLSDINNESNYPPRKIPFVFRYSVLLGGLYNSMAWIALAIIIFIVVIMTKSEFFAEANNSIFKMISASLLFLHYFYSFVLKNFYLGMKESITSEHLLRNGIISVGSLVSKTKKLEGDKTLTITMEWGEKEEDHDVYDVYQYTFEFKAIDGKIYRTVAKNFTAFWENVSDVLENSEKKITILYDPYNPNRAIVLETLPGKPTLERQKKLVQRNPEKAFVFLFIPYIVVLLSLIFIFFG
ncbi:hypothetical protein [Candidatus Uabimicrobium sp. HlEnr_7]|uniref:DUF3592 domain-containing protein n=1 Tax=Candidatus Uabimicrobium helgolandensis TaxID=3095367 RepID=UPI00355919FC